MGAIPTEGGGNAGECSVATEDTDSMAEIRGEDAFSNEGLLQAETLFIFATRADPHDSRERRVPGSPEHDGAAA